MPSPISPEEFQKRIADKFNNTIKATDDYINSDTTLNFLCITCASTWENTPRNILDKRNKLGCPTCAHIYRGDRTRERLTMPFELMLERLTSIPTINYISGYTNASTRCLWKCSVCEHEWETSPNSILNMKTGCPKCSHKGPITPVSAIVAAISKVSLNSVSYLKGYIDKYHKCFWKCSICDHEWQRAPYTMITSGACPNCRLSSGERNIKILLDTAGINYLQQYSPEDLKGRTGLPLRFDFAIFNEGIVTSLIEYDGKQHTKPIEYFGGIKRFAELQYNDFLKTQYCMDKGLKLVRIPYRKKFGIEDLI